MQFDRNKSLQELEDADWGEPRFPSHLVTACHRLRRVPLREFGVEDMRIMIGQNIGLAYLIPMALERLAADAFVEGNFYPGDLLSATLQVEERFWDQRSDLRDRLAAIAGTALSEMERSDDCDTVERHLSAACRRFRGRSTSR